ncbi:MAG: hypothetical protein GYA33_14375 [Thermogutta sp.]|nr:hypothetical protein [Thermogutta sp.]
MTQRSMLLWAAAAWLLLPLAGASAQDACAPACAPEACAPACAPVCKPVVPCVQKTVWVRQVCTEMRTVRCVQYVPQEKEYTVHVVKLVPETTTVEKEFVEWTTETRTKEVRYTVCKPVWETATREYTVMVPKCEKVQGTRKVCKMVPVKETRKICVDEGGWEERPCQPVCTVRCRCCHRRVVTACCPPACAPSACAPSACEPPACAAPAATCKVWVSKPVIKEVEVTCLRPQWVEEPCEYTRVVCVPEKRTCQVKVCRWERQERVKQCQYTVCVPKKVVRPVQVTVCKRVVEPCVKKCTVMVPCVVEKQVPVRVCKRVPMTVTVPARRCHRLHHRAVGPGVCCDC